ncbi:MAG: RagB/SusD family nutrient uptake outer membrane protein [Tannerella sp.]|jgi:hypothetical protein|nr:RagB/SusD family nutrient uptake outer membrane protein [Tannerella sp.]
MKKYILFLLVIIFTSCNDLLELPYDGRTTIERVFTTKNGIGLYRNACYNYLLAPHYSRSSLCDDSQDADGVFANSLYSFWYGNAFSSSSFSATDGNPWTSLFEGVRKCNIFLAHIKGVKGEDVMLSEVEITRMTAEVYTLRALYYLELIKRYGPVPLITEAYSATHDFSADRRASFSEIVTQILTDCDAALATPDVQQGFSWNVFYGQAGIMTRAVAYAIKSQAATYAASPFWADGTYTWAMATEINKEALFQCINHGYELFEDTPKPAVAQNAYALYFITRPDEQRAYDKETIYGGTAVEVWRNAGMPSTPGQLTAGACPTQELVDCYEMQATGEPPVNGYSDAQHLNPIINAASGYDPAHPYAGRDPRFYATIYYNGAARTLPAGTDLVNTCVGETDGITVSDRRTTRTGYYLRKYNRWTSNRDNNADGAVRLFRLAEIYLNFAESAYQSDGPDTKIDMGRNKTMSARDAVNAIRNRAGMPPFPAGMSKEAFEKKYRNERRVEFAFEEHRFFDVRRWKIVGETERYVSGMSITQKDGNLTYTRISFERGSFSDKYYLYPIPPSEVTKMQDFTGINWQNDGWN